MGSWHGRAALAGGIAMLVAGAAAADVPRLDLSLGAWQHTNEGTLSSNDPLLAIPTGFELDDTQDSYARFGVRLGSAWWAPVIRARYTTTAAEGSTFEDNSLYVGPILVALNTTASPNNGSFSRTRAMTSRRPTWPPPCCMRASGQKSRSSNTTGNVIATGLAMTAAI